MAPALLPTVLRSAVRAHEVAAMTAGLRLTLECDTSLGTIPLVMDAGRIGQVVTNFLSNAVQFTPRGGSVTVRAAVLASPAPPLLSSAGASRRRAVGAAPSAATVRSVGDDSGPADVWTIRVSVKDTGRGIAPTDLGRLFQPYTQIRAADMQAGWVLLAFSFTRV